MTTRPRAVPRPDLSPGPARFPFAWPRCASSAAALLFGIFLPGAWTGCEVQPRETASAKPQMTFKPREMADALHAVIAADRTAYARLVVQRLAYDEPRIPCTEDWEKRAGLPVPAQLLRYSSIAVASRGVEFSYMLRSLWPINARNRPETALERQGLEFLAQNPGTNFYAEETLGGRHYLTAIYPDAAVTAACVECHNGHPQSPRKDFKPGDVMGGIVLRVALEF